MTTYELLTLHKPYQLLLDVKASVSFNDVVTRKERPSIIGKVSTLLLANVWCTRCRDISDDIYIVTFDCITTSVYNQ